MLRHPLMEILESPMFRGSSRRECFDTSFCCDVQELRFPKTPDVLGSCVSMIIPVAPQRQMLGRNSYPVYETLPCLGRFCLPDAKARQHQTKKYGTTLRWKKMWVRHTVDAIHEAPGIFASLLWAAGEQGAVVPGVSVSWMNFMLFVES